MGQDVTQALVSIVVRTKDRPKLLQRALRSIAAQTYRPLEVVLVNDGGCDLDLDVAGKTLNDVELSYVRLETNRGRAAAANAGVLQCRGDYLGFLDDDDEFYPDHVRSLVDALNEAGRSVAYSDCEMVTRIYDFETMSHEETERRVLRSRDFSLAELLLENYIPLIATLFRRQVFAVSGGFDEELIAYEDWDFFLRCGYREPFVHLPKVTAKYIQWSPQEQIAQSPAHWDLLDGPYRKVVTKHRGKFTPETVRVVRDELNRRIEEAERQTLEICRRDEGIRGLTAKARESESLIGELRQRCGDLEEELRERERQLQFMQAGRGWRLLVRYYRLRDRILRVFGKGGVCNRGGV